MTKKPGRDKEPAPLLPIVPAYLNEQHDPFWPKRTRLPFPVVDQDGNVIEPGMLVVVSNGKVQK